MLTTVKVQDPEAENGERLLSPVEEGQVGDVRRLAVLALAQVGPSERPEAAAGSQAGSGVAA